MAPSESRDIAKLFQSNLPFLSPQAFHQSSHLQSLHQTEAATMSYPCGFPALPFFYQDTLKKPYIKFSTRAQPNMFCTLSSAALLSNQNPVQIFLCTKTGYLSGVFELIQNCSVVYLFWSNKYTMQIHPIRYITDMLIAIDLPVVTKVQPLLQQCPVPPHGEKHLPTSTSQHALPSTPLTQL